MRTYHHHDPQVRDLRNRTVTEWIEKIQTLPQPAQNHVALVVWWDYYGGRTQITRVSEFDDYLVADLHPCPRRDIFESLLQLGYTPTLVHRRLPPLKHTKAHKDMYEKPLYRKAAKP